MVTYSIREAAELAGVTQRWLRGRVDRGQLRAVKDAAGIRRIPQSELMRAGLLGEDGSPRAAVVAHGQPAMGSSGHGQPRAALDVQELLTRLERQAEEIGRLRLLTERVQESEADRQARKTLEAELHEQRALVAQLQARDEEREVLLTDLRTKIDRPSWWRRLFGAEAAATP